MNITMALAALDRIEAKLDSMLVTKNHPRHHLGHTWITFAVTLVTAMGLLA
jgi:hypothetical protein